MWWQILGDPHAILDLAADIDGLGRLRQHCYGSVRRWRTLDSAADPDRAGHHTASGQVIRRLRTSTLSDIYGTSVPDGIAVEHAQPVAPYWMKDGAASVVEMIFETD
jgi:hypothetical protein